MLGIIAGTGFYEMKLLQNAKVQHIQTPYGEAEVYMGEYKEKPIAFLPRHGKGHSIPPHSINYRAHIAALHSLGMQRILAINAVGSLSYDLPPGSLVLINDFLDFTYGREHTYFTGGEAGVGHISMCEPYCKEWQEEILRAAQNTGAKLATGGVYVATQGPRFESPAEIKMFAMLGGTVVGMTGVPEVCLAAEKGLCYGAVSVVTNLGSGMTETIAHGEVVGIMNKTNAILENLLEELIENYVPKRNCTCDSRCV